MKSWSYNHGHQHLRAPIEASFDSKEVFTGILADIGEPSIVRATSNKTNHGHSEKTLRLLNLLKCSLASKSSQKFLRVINRRLRDQQAVELE